ncbi:hypothetical protein FAF44_40810 [Nonomuraea sp. MG754425]|uniref:TfuA-like protein n=1 Tax=Nonomuraea sp. MG754425 TaxID=2570319 RepID=UPI001F17129C|nr:TfuA domain-containing protein [Nonomuraea sp. MG754425]MCF6474677.1 hypothetical protein [Nonomuraea sp. MG754425]
MRRFLFVGPSLPGAREHVGGAAHVLPPVRAGGLLALDPGPGDVIGIVDGLFHQVRSVQHKEILHAIGCGASVLGAASMGALRAAELAPFGMRGVGRVHADFASGRLTADDEVAVVHTGREHGYRGLTFPLVSLRYTLEDLTRSGGLSPGEAERILGHARALHYSERTFARLGDLVDVETLRSAWMDAKKDDALALIDAMSRPPGPADPGNARVPDTIYLHGWRLSREMARTGAGPALRVYQLFGSDYPEFYARLVADLVRNDCLARCGPQADTPFGDPLLDHAHHDGHLPPGEPPAPLRNALIAAFRLHPDVTPDAEAGRRLLALGLGPRAREIHDLARTVNQDAESRIPGFSTELIPDDRLAGFAGDLYGVRPDDLENTARMRGISGAEPLIAALRPYYLLAKYNPETVALALRDP